MDSSQLIIVAIAATYTVIPFGVALWWTGRSAGNRVWRKPLFVAFISASVVGVIVYWLVSRENPHIPTIGWTPGFSAFYFTLVCMLVFIKTMNSPAIVRFLDRYDSTRAKSILTMCILIGVIFNAIFFAWWNYGIEMAIRVAFFPLFFTFSMLGTLLWGTLMLVIPVTILLGIILVVRWVTMIARGKDPFTRNKPLIGGALFMACLLVAIVVTAVAPYEGLQDGPGELFFMMDRAIIFYLSLTTSLLIARITRIILDWREKRKIVITP